MGLVDDLNAVKDQLGKAKVEIVSKIGDLEIAVATAGQPSAEVAAAVASLKEAAQALDDVVPDAVAEAVAEAAVEPVVVDEEVSE